jgi:hypothetical protein
MIGITISMRKPRSGDFTQLDPGETSDQDIGGIIVQISNARDSPVYLKWRI